MEFLVSPLFSPFILIVTGLFACGAVLRWEKTFRSKIVFLVLICLLVFLGFRPQLARIEEVPPENPLTIVHENSHAAKQKQIPSSAFQLKTALKRQLPKAQIKIEPLDDRWDSPPSFRDYNRLSDLLSPADPIQVVVGEGIHTSPESFVSHLNQAPNRYLWDSTSDSPSRGYLTVERSVVFRDQPGPVEWKARWEGFEQRDGSALFLKEGGRVLEKLTIESSSQKQSKITLPAREEGIYHFVLELRDSDEPTLPPAHPRRVDLGLVISSESPGVFLYDDRPAWQSGWWGRKISAIEPWSLDYSYRNDPGGLSDSLSEQSRTSIFFSLPQTSDELQIMRKQIDSPGSLMVVVDGPPATSSAEEALEVLELPTNHSYRKSKGEFFPRVPSEAIGTVPALAALENLFASGPPFGTLIRAPSATANYLPLILTEHGDLLWWNQRKNIAIMFTDSFHRWALRWARLGHPEAGTKWVREWVGKLVREGEPESGNLLTKHAARAGEPVRLVEPKRGQRLQVFLDNTLILSDSNPSESIIFPRPGRYQVQLISGEEPILSESIVVTVPEAERLDSPTMSKLSITPDHQFHSRQSLMRILQREWKRLSTKQPVPWLSWDDLSVALLMIGLFTLGWWLRDRPEGN